MRVDAGGVDAVPFEYRVRFYIPDGYVPTANPELTVVGNVATFRTTPTAPGTLTITLPF
jgi:hypothetical protein